MITKLSPQPWILCWTYIIVFVHNTQSKIIINNNNCNKKFCNEQKLSTRHQHFLHDQENLIHGLIPAFLNECSKNMEVRKLNLVVAAFLAIVSVWVPFVLFVRQLWPLLLKRRPYVYAHTFAPFYFKYFTKLCLSAVRFVLVPFFFRPFKQNTVCCSPVFHYLHFMPFSYGFVR